MKTQLCIHKVLHNQFGEMCKLHLGPFNLSIAMFLFIPNTALHQVMFCFQATDRRSSPCYSSLGSPFLPYGLCSYIRIYCRCLLSLAGRGLCSAKMSKRSSGTRVWPCTHSDTSRWLEMVGERPSEKKKEKQTNKKTHFQNRRDEHGKVLNVPLASRKWIQVQ